MAAKRLYRSSENKVLAGIFGGLGEYFDVDPVLLRIAWVAITIFTGVVPGLIVYALAFLVVPERHTIDVQATLSGPVG